MLCFGCVPVMLKDLTEFLDPWTVNAVRYGTAAMFWLPFVIVLGRKFKEHHTGPPRRSIWLAALVPAAVNTLGQIGWALCPYYVGATTIGFVIRVSFLFTAVLALLVFPSERLLARRPLFYVGATVSIAGVALMYVQRLGGDSRDASQTLGLVILVVTSLGWAGYVVCARRFLAGYPVRLAIGVLCLYTTAALVVVMLLSWVLARYGWPAQLPIAQPQRLADLPPARWAVLIGSAIVGVAFGHIFYLRGVHGIGPVVANGITLVGPFWTYLIAMYFLGETMTGLQVVGGLTVVAGGLALIKAKARADRLAKLQAAKGD